MIFFKLTILFVSATTCFTTAAFDLSTPKYDFVNLTPHLQKQLPNLHPTMPFVHFDLGLSDEHKKILQKLILNKQGSYNTFGNFDEMISQVTAFLKSLGNTNTTASTVAQIIHDIVMQVLCTLNSESAWVAIRCFKKQDTFKIPRWHTDGQNPMVYAIGCSCKIVCTLKGPSTRFCNVPETVRNEFDLIASTSDINNPVTRQKLCNLLSSSIVETAQPYQATMFLMGDYAAIHSEPDIVQDRLYLGICPGTKDQIAQMCN